MLYRTSVAPVFTLRREIDRLFEDTFGGGGSNGRAGWSPAAEIQESEKELRFTFELAGVKPDDVEITCDKGTLTVRGQRSEERKEGDEGRYHLLERSYGTFTRSFQLPQNVDEDQIDAQFENGLLFVRVPKAALPQPRRISVNAPGQSTNKDVGRVTGDQEHRKAAAPTSR